MGNLILNIVQNYFITGIAISVFVDLVIRLTRISEPFSFKQVLGFIIVWPLVITTLISEAINGES